VDDVNRLVNLDQALFVAQVKRSIYGKAGFEIVKDGNGILAATAALAVVGKVMMATEDHDYSEESTHEINCVVNGCVEAQKVSGSGAAKKGQKLMISATAGECTLFVKGDVTATVNQSTANAALDKNAGAFGAASADSADAETTQKLWL
jgi:hypothetical protein